MMLRNVLKCAGWVLAAYGAVALWTDTAILLADEYAMSQYHQRKRLSRERRALKTII